MKKIGLYLLLTTLALGIGYAVGRYISPEKVKVEKQVVVKEVEVIKKDVKIVEKEIKRPDGTIEKEKVIEDKSQEIKKSELESKEIKIVKNNKPDWRVNGLIGVDKTQNFYYGVNIEKRIVGPFFTGIFILNRANMEISEGVIGVSVGLEF